jgi:hypothetical protein
MNKVRLNLEQLQVESFDTHPARLARGTVRGNFDDDLGGAEAIVTPPTKPSLDCCPLSAGCPPLDTILASCPATCPATCPNTCDLLCTYGCTEELSVCRFTGDPICCA